MEYREMPPLSADMPNVDEDCSVSTSGPSMLSGPSFYPPTVANQSPFVALPLDPPHHDINNDITSESLAGMGLPVEVWLYIIDFLARDAVSLLACALTCRYFRSPAQNMIDQLRERTIDANGYDDLNNLAEEILHSPKRRAGMAIRSLKVAGKTNDSIPVVLSVIPIRLSRMLLSLHNLTFENFTVNTQPYPSRWMLYGSSFPNLTNLELGFIKFPSFKDFVVLVTSLPALATLRLSYPSLNSSAGFLPGVLKHFNKQKFSIQELTLQDDNRSSFLAIFVKWLIWRDAQVHTLSIAQCIPSKPGQQLLRHFRGSLRDLKIHYMATPGCVFGTQEIHKMTEPFCIEYPALSSIAIYAINERDIPGFTSILPYIVPSLRTLSLWVSPSSESFSDSAWECLDAIVSAWFMVKHTHHETKLDLRYMTWPGDQGRLVESLFPLATSLGKGSWCIVSN